jgi:hypothetical protein
MKADQFEFKAAGSCNGSREDDSSSWNHAALPSALFLSRLGKGISSRGLQIDPLPVIQLF